MLPKVKTLLSNPANVDYQSAITNPAFGVLVFATGSTAGATLSAFVSIIDDENVEVTESFNVSGSVNVAGDVHVVFSGESFINILDPDGEYSSNLYLLILSKIPYYCSTGYIVSKLFNVMLQMPACVLMSP